jgi:hypothetical protein
MGYILAEMQYSQRASRGHVVSPEAAVVPTSGPLAPVWQVLGTVLDPEVPALSVVDLGLCARCWPMRTGWRCAHAHLRAARPPS